MNTFRHAGDLGDIVASLPVVRYFGGGVLYIEAADYTRQKLTPDNWCGLDLLLKQQHYIEDVRPWNRERVTINLNDFRARLTRAVSINQHVDRSLVDWMLETHQVPHTAKETPWLSVEPIRVKRVVINRTSTGRKRQHVYHNPLFPWHRVWRKYWDNAVFVGTPHEHRVFCATSGEVPYVMTNNLLEAAQVIAGADLFIGNQSCCHWIAEGLKKNIVLEVWPAGPNSLNNRPGVVHGWDENTPLPDL